MRRHTFQHANVSHHLRWEAKAMNAINGLQVVRCIKGSIHVDGVMADMVQANPLASRGWVCD